MRLPAILTEGEVRRRSHVDRPDVPLPDTLPAFGDLRMDQEDRIWVQEFVPTYDDRAPLWWVIDREGAFIGRVAVPRGFDPRVIAAGHVTGVYLDELEVPFIQKRRIVRD